MLAKARYYTQICAALECPTMQILTQHCLDDLPEETRLEILTENIGEITRIGRPYGVRYRIEIICHTAFNSLDQALEVIRRVNAPNLGLVIDFWHLHGSGKQTPEDVSKLDPTLIYGVHFCDGVRGIPGQPRNEEVLRNALPGQGEVDLQAWTDAVKSTGFDGVWSAELVSPTNWERDLWEVASEELSSMLRYYHRSDTEKR
jgi:Sugar phosphate isomerases/epimerases